MPGIIPKPIKTTIHINVINKSLLYSTQTDLEKIELGKKHIKLSS